MNLTNILSEVQIRLGYYILDTNCISEQIYELISPFIWDIDSNVQIKDHIYFQQ